MLIRCGIIGIILLLLVAQSPQANAEDTRFSDTLRHAADNGMHPGTRDMLLVLDQVLWSQALLPAPPTTAEQPNLNGPPIQQAVRKPWMSTEEGLQQVLRRAADNGMHPGTRDMLGVLDRVLHNLLVEGLVALAGQSDFDRLSLRQTVAVWEEEVQTSLWEAFCSWFLWLFPWIPLKR